MTLEEAIKILKREVDGKFINNPHELEKAQELGIEALRHFKQEKELGDVPHGFLLPSETVK